MGESAEDKVSCIIVVDGEQYDLTDFLTKHPGGPVLLLFMHGRDATIAVNTVHKDPVKTVYPVLQRYKIEPTQKKDDILKKKLGVPHFLLPEDYDANTDNPSYNFDPKDDSLLLNKVRKRILQKDVQQKIKHLDRMFDATCVGLLAAYLALLLFWLMGLVPWFISVPAFVMLRTAIAGGGHYYVHYQSKLEFFFDINYVGNCFAARDGHVLLHHVFTQHDADVKRGFFGGMMGVPRLLRIFAHTIHKIGHISTGLFFRSLQLVFAKESDDDQGIDDKLRRLGIQSCSWPMLFSMVWLRVELLLAVSLGLWWSWLAQFILSLWLNTLLVVSSHDFTTVLEPDQKDWARYQLLNAHDMHITGNPWLDCFLGAGLAQHRAHHILPYQKSGWANRYSEQFIAEAAKEAGLPWLPAKNLFTEIFPDIVSYQLMAPVCDPVSRKQTYSSFMAEHVDPRAWWFTLKYICSGFVGIGSA